MSTDVKYVDNESLTEAELVPHPPNGVDEELVVSRLDGDFLTLVLLPVVIFTFPRFILLPWSLVRLFGSPKYMNFPFLLWALIYYTSLLGLVSLKGQFDFLNNWKCENVYGIDENEKNLYFSKKVVTRGLVVVILLDLISSLIVCLISLLLAFGVFVNGDGKIDPGWRADYMLVVTGCIFSLASIFLNIFLVICFCYPQCCRCLLDKSRDKDRDGQERDGRIQSGDDQVDEDDTSLTTTSVVSTQLKISRYPQIHRALVALLFVFVCICVGFHCSYLVELGRRAKGDNKIQFSECDEMVTHSCMLPFPSSTWLTTDSSTFTGRIVSINSSKSTPSIIKEGRGERFSADFVSSHYDGFSVTGPLLWHLTGFVDNSELALGAAKQLISDNKVSTSMDWNISTSLLIDQNTWELHPHFCQIDYITKHEDERICYCQPAKNLAYNTTYIVVIRNLNGRSGTKLRASPLYDSYLHAYQAGKVSLNDDPRYLRFKEIIFPALKVNGVNLSEVQLAWDFHTVSFESSAKFISSLYDITIDKMMDAYGSSFTSDHVGLLSEVATKIESGLVSADECHAIVNYTDGTQNGMAAKAYYRVKVPWLLTNRDYINTELIPQLRDRGYGNKYQNDPSRIKVNNQGDLFLEEVGILVQVPCSIALGQSEVYRVIEWGHGIFSAREEASSSALMSLANQHGWVMWSAEWRGFDRHSFPMLARQLMHDGGIGISDVYNNLLQGLVSKIAVRSFALPKIFVNDWLKKDLQQRM